MWAVKNYSGLLATRFFLGFAEAGVFPGTPYHTKAKSPADSPLGCFYILSMWYKREEAQRRFTLFFGSATLAGAFGSLLASAIQKMDGTRGLSGWRWIFILEGMATIILSCIAYFIIPNFPENATWLTVDERKFMTQRLLTSSDEPSLSSAQSRGLLGFFADLKSWMGAFMYFGKLSTHTSCLFF